MENNNKFYKYRKFAGEKKAEYLDTLKKLITIPSPSYKEQKIAEFIRTFLLKSARKYHYQNQNLRIYMDDIFNVYCEIKKECITKKDAEKGIPLSADMPYYIVMAHIDTVFPDEGEIVYQERDGRLYGLGAKDNRANICALLYCGEYIFKNQIVPKENLLFVFDVCEEGTGNLRGCKRVFERYKNVSAMIAFDLDYTAVFCRAVGSMRYKIKVKTKGGHSFHDFGAENAIVVMAEIIQKFYGIDVNSFEGKTTLNVGKIFGGTTVNAIADQCEALVEWRSDSEKTLGEIDKMIDSIIESIHRKIPAENRIEKNRDVKITKELIGFRPSGKCFDRDKESLQRELIACVKSAAEEISGINAVLSSGSTDCNVPLSMGIPAVCIGTCIGGGEHTREEYVEINSLEKGLAAALAVLDNWI